MEKIEKKCNFCGCKDTSKKYLRSKSQLCICEDCVYAVHALMSRYKSKIDNVKITVQSPKEIKSSLDKYVIGQEQAKKILSVAVFKHLKLQEYYKQNPKEPKIEIEKSNVLLVGPTGCGKTHLVESVARVLDVPYVIVDASSLTSSGYYGEDVENIIRTLLDNANDDVKKAEQGIVFIDEIDKKASVSKEGSEEKRDISGKEVQNELLKLIEGKTVTIPGGFCERDKKVDTSKMLFIFGGAFCGIEEIIKARLKINSKNVGLVLDEANDGNTISSDIDDVIPLVKVDDFYKYGMIPEFIGRIPIICPFQQLSVSELKRILIEPTNALIQQYKELFNIDNIRLCFDDDALTAIAEEAAVNKLGARGLRSIVERVLLDLLFDYSNFTKGIECPTVTITKDCVLGKSEPLVEYQQEQLKFDF